MWDSCTNIVFIYASALLALVWALLNAWSITSIDIDKEAQDEESQSLTQDKNKIETIKKIKDKISEGANAFLFKEYSIMTLFIVVFGIVVFAIVDIWGQ